MATAEREAAAKPASIPLKEYWPRRYTLVGMCFFGTFICYIDRVNISVAVIPMVEEFGWNETVRGVVLSSFFIGYLATQIAGGWLADRFGGKVVLGLGVLVWSGFTLITPPAAALGLAVLIAARVGMGLGEGVAFPSIYSLFARWIPLKERTRSIGLNYSGIPLGTVFALLVTPIIVARMGWEWAFYLFGGAGIIWYAFWYFLAASTPEKHPTIDQREIDHIRQDLGAAPKIEKTPWKKILSKGPVWAIIINHFCNNWGLYVILTWLPTYVNQALGVDVELLGLYTVVPFAVSFLFLNAGGWVADTLIKRGFTVTATRKIMQTIGFLGPAFFLGIVGFVTDAIAAITIMSCATALGAFAMGGFAVNHLDIGPRYAGILLGISNTAGTIPGIVGVTLTGIILDVTGSWAIVFGVAAGIYIIGLIVWLAMATGERILE